MVLRLQSIPKIRLNGQQNTRDPSRNSLPLDSGYAYAVFPFCLSLIRSIARGALSFTTPFTVGAYTSLWALANIGLFLLPAVLFAFFAPSLVCLLHCSGGSVHDTAFTLSYCAVGAGVLLILYGMLFSLLPCLR
jgi:hypothetical protein